jgi:hypothetical protein
MPSLSSSPCIRLNRAAKQEDGCIGLTLPPFEHRRVGADLHCSRPRHQGASSLSSSVPGVSRSERTTETTLSAQRIMFQARKTYSQWSAGFRLTRTSARTVTNSIVNKATSADAAWISPVHQT